MKIENKIKRLAENCSDKYIFTIEILKLIESMPQDGPEHNAYYSLQENMATTKQALGRILLGK